MRTKRKKAPTMSVCPNGTVLWTLRGQLHREDGPAVITSAGVEMWYLHDRRHRLDGPALVNEPMGYYEWHLDGRYHRMHEPAVIHGNGNREWWVNGQHITDEVEAWLASNGIAHLTSQELRMEFLLRWG